MSFPSEQIDAWLDGELPPEEAARLDEAARNDESLRRLRHQHRAYLAQLSQAMPADEDLPYADFFMNRLERRIEEEALERRRPATAVESVNSRWLSWLPWGLTAASAAALALVIAGSGSSETSPSPAESEVPVLAGNSYETVEDPGTSAVLSTYSPRAEVIASADPAGSSLVMVLDGLPEYQGDIRGTGLRLSQLQGSTSTRAPQLVAN